MPFRAKLKRAFGGSSGTEYDPSNPLTHAPNKRAKKDYPDNVYKPGEAMPKPKYRGPWNQTHQDKLSAFTFGDAWKRRKSSTMTTKSVQGNSECSPMGSRMPSRGPSRRGSTWSGFSMKGGKRPGGVGSREPSGQNIHERDKVTENEQDDGDVMNVGNSRPLPQEDKPPPPPPKDDTLALNGLRMETKVKNGHLKENSRLQPLDTQETLTNGQIFTADELANAMSQSTLKSSKKDGL